MSFRISWHMSLNDTESRTCYPRTQHIEVFLHSASLVPDFLYEPLCPGAREASFLGLEKVEGDSC